MSVLCAMLSCVYSCGGVYLYVYEWVYLSVVM